jgi:hypothetical protein
MDERVASGGDLQQYGARMTERALRRFVRTSTATGLPAEM